MEERGGGREKVRGKGGREREKTNGKKLFTFDAAGAVDIPPSSSSVLGLFPLFRFLLVCESCTAVLCCRRSSSGGGGLGGSGRLGARCPESGRCGDQRFRQRPPPLGQRCHREAVEARLLLEFLEETVFEGGLLFRARVRERRKREKKRERENVDRRSVHGENKNSKTQKKRTLSPFGAPRLPPPERRWLPPRQHWPAPWPAPRRARPSCRRRKRKEKRKKAEKEAGTRRTKERRLRPPPWPRPPPPRPPPRPVRSRLGPRRRRRRRRAPAGR